VQRGVQVHHPARAISVAKDMKDQLASIRIAERTSSTGTDDEASEMESDIPCTRLIITAGAWTPSVVRTLFPSSSLKVPISKLAGHSLLLRSPRWTTTQAGQGAHAVFANDAGGFAPELFGRTGGGGGEIYLAGLNSSTLPLPESGMHLETDEKSVRQLRDVAEKLLGLPEAGDDVEVTRASVCFRPVTPSGRPIVSRIPDEALGGGFMTRRGGEGGVFIAAGHGPWGITMSLGTGYILTEMIEGQDPSVNVKALRLS
jgi:glycine/D-amino acid oxidase-like deaminating enzyme